MTQYELTFFETDCQEFDQYIDIFTAANLGDADQIGSLLARDSKLVNQTNAKHWTPLMSSAYAGHHNCVSYLLTQGADPLLKTTTTNQLNYAENNLLCLAAKCSKDHVIRILLNFSNELKTNYLNLRDDRTGSTPLFCTAHFGYHMAALELLRAGAKTEIINEKQFGRTALLQACANGHELVVQSLLKFNADVDAIDLNGDSAMSLAQAKDHYKIVDLLDHYHAKNLNKMISAVKLNVKQGTSATGAETATIRVSISKGPAELEKMKPEKKPKPKSQAAGKLKLPNLEAALIESDLAKYYDNFLQRNCDMTIFLTLTEHELKSVYDIKLFGPRRKLFLLIKKLRNVYL